MTTRGNSTLLCRPAENEVHVWLARVSEVAAEVVQLESTLSEQELHAAARLLRTPDRTRYVCAHGILREVLGRYLATAPADLEFFRDVHGKPHLARGSGGLPLMFNLAHSGDFVACGLAWGRRVGVDIEEMRPEVSVLELAESQFAPAEAEALRELGSAERCAAFFRCWTRKEAYVKARGEGLGLALSRFAVTLRPDEAPELTWVADDASEVERWSMFDLDPAPGYAGAVVVEGRPARMVSIRRLQPE